MTVGNSDHNSIHSWHRCIEMKLDWNTNLDVAFNLEKDLFYRKPNNTPPYICSKSNHTPSITKQLSSMTSRRISSLTCQENEFNKGKHFYESALKSSGFSYNKKFEAPAENARRNINWKIIWFEGVHLTLPPHIFSVQVRFGVCYITGQWVTSSEKDKRNLTPTPNLNPNYPLLFSIIKFVSLSWYHGFITFYGLFTAYLLCEEVMSVRLYGSVCRRV